MYRIILNQFWHVATANTRKIIKKKTWDVTWKNISDLQKYLSEISLLYKYRYKHIPLYTANERDT